MFAVAVFVNDSDFTIVFAVNNFRLVSSMIVSIVSVFVLLLIRIELAVNVFVVFGEVPPMAFMIEPAENCFCWSKSLILTFAVNVLVLTFTIIASTVNVLVLLLIKIESAEKVKEGEFTRKSFRS